MLSEIFKFLTVVVLCITGLAALLLVLMALPNSPLRDLAISFGKRVGMTAAAGALVLPMDLIPVSGELYDLVALVAVAYYWYTFFKELETRQQVKAQGSIVIPTVAPRLNSSDEN